MSRLMNAMRLLVLAVCVAPLLALAAPGSSYRVALGGLPGADPGAVAKQLAAEYHGHLETPVDEHGTFLMTLTAATADLLRRDPRVSGLERQEVAASAAVAPNASATWTLGDGNYQYDGSGNIKAIGSQVFVYDVEDRLVSEGTIGTTATKQKYTYDGFGNILTYKDDDGFTYTVGASAATNRASVTSSSAFHMSGTYDNAGNMTGRSDDTFRYDALNVMTKSFVDGQWRAYVYNVNEERVGTILMTAETGGAETSSEWTIRDPGGQVLRRFAKQGGQYVWQQDYIYRDGKMLASEVTGQIGTLHYHLDHLGSPRLITGNGGVQVSRHTYYPFGKEVVTGQPVREDKKFTGHERDPIELDYMHARFYDYRMGRFLSVDPGRDWDPREPQSWNMYTYGRNNPVNGTDPDGRFWGWVVNLGRKGLKKIQKVELDDAVRSMQEGEDIYGASQQKARHAARKAGKGEPDLDPPHGPKEEGFEPHYHAVDENGERIKGYGHAFFQGAVGFAISLIPGMDAEATGMATANPLLERRAQKMFGRSYFELNADERRAIFESFRDPEEERQPQRDDVPVEPQQ